MFDTNIPILVLASFAVLTHCPVRKMAFIPSLVAVSVNIDDGISVSESWKSLLVRFKHNTAHCRNGQPYDDRQQNYTTLHTSPCDRFKITVDMEEAITVTVLKQFYLNITFAEFDVANSYNNCSLQSLNINTENRPVLQQCGWRVPWSEYFNKSYISFFIESRVSYPAVVSVIYDITEPHEVKYQDEMTVSTVYLTQTSPHYLEVSKYSYVRDIQTQFDLSRGFQMTLRMIFSGLVSEPNIKSSLPNTIVAVSQHNSEQNSFKLHNAKLGLSSGFIVHEVLSLPC